MSTQTNGRQEALATLGGGCFWCVEAVFKELQGVREVISGYAGGHVKNPSYREVCGKRTGHAEVVQVHFDPEVITYREVLDIFFTTHDPTTQDRQGNDVGPQYRSIVLYHDDAQRETAEAAKEAAQEYWDDLVVTEIEPLETFYRAEDYHQNYFDKNPDQPYCQVVVAPKVAKARQKYAHRLKTA